MNTKTRSVYIYYLQEAHLRHEDIYRLKVKKWRKIFHANGNQKKAGVVILIQDKIDFKIKRVTKDKEDYYIIIKGFTEEDAEIIIMHPA